ncbi:MAG: hypothetical protein LAQ69_48610 [Acidobacteriia bacterium]|nr:hypothetical protein [Terriglobia bacterium]
MLPRHWKTALVTALWAATCSQPGLAQVAAPTILQIDIANHVLYFGDSDVSKFGTDPNVTTSAHVGNFSRGVAIADIVAVNGQRVMGTHTKDAGGAALRTAPGPGQGIADTVRNGLASATFEILKSDGTPIGTIVATGLAGGDAPPGSPLTVTGNNFVITGGTGAFLGVRGQLGTASNLPGVAVQRAASMTEDPANRRQNGGGTQRFVAYLIPMSVPQIVTTASGPAVSHSSDFSPVTSSKPAAAGEVLSLFATGLGPTVPAVDPGQPFPSSPAATVNSPIEVKVNGNSAEVLGAVGFPGSLDGYQVNFRVPQDTAKGAATIQVSAAWIAGTAVQIAVQ